ncbi:cell division protein FtsX [Xanthobacter sp. TB0139]|uniref:cell division protein FtsX n=1 Tax=Xanthobacter sp. TB0139 TaxID=3459178 RepID=UPI00403A54E6
MAGTDAKNPNGESHDGRAPGMAAPGHDVRPHGQSQHLPNATPSRAGVFRTQATPRPLPASQEETPLPASEHKASSGRLKSEDEAAHAGQDGPNDKAGAGAQGDITPAARPTAKERPQASIVPRSTISGRALVAVVAIMTFLASLTVGAAFGVRATASQWRSDVTREITIQIRAGEPATTNAEVKLATEIASKAPGVADVHVLSAAETAGLLEPWLGAGLELDDLPVPRVVVVRLDNSGQADIPALRRTLGDRIPTASLDDHRTWSRRLSATAEGVTLAGLGLLVLVGIATVLSVVFATRAAVATNRTVVEVLHFVGARDGFIAAQFQRHFLKIGAQGGLLGGLAAVALFGLLVLLPRFGLSGNPEDASLLTWLDPGLAGFIGIALVVVLVACATALTSRFTVYRTLRNIQ